MLATVCSTFAMMPASVGYAQNAPRSAPLPARINVERITLQQTVHYSVEVEGDISNIIPPNTTDFRVVGRSTGTSMTFIHGQLQRTMSATWSLAPTRSGTLNTGTATVIYNDGSSRKTQSFNIYVDEDAGSRSPSAPSGTSQGAPPSGMGTPGTMPPIPGAPLPPGSTPTPPSGPFGVPLPPQIPGRQSPPATTNDAPNLALPLSETFHTNREGIDTSRPFVVAYASSSSAVRGQPLLIEYVYFAPLTGMGYDATDLTEPAFVNAWFRDITSERTQRGSRLGNVQVGGQVFSAQIVRSYMVVPLSEGRFDAAPLSLVIEGRSFTRRTGPIPIASPKLYVDITLPPTQGKPADDARSVGRLELSVRMSPSSVNSGEVVHLTMEVRGIGAGSFIHLPAYTAPDAFRAFTPTDTEETEVQADGWVHTTLRRTLTFQATKAGVYTFAPVVFSWYDPWKAQWETQRSDAFTVKVAGANIVEDEAPHERANENGPALRWTDNLPTPEAISPGFGPIARMRTATWRGSPFFYGLCALPILLTIAVLAIGRWRKERLATRPQRERDDAARNALRALKDLRYRDINDFSSLQRIARQYLATRIGPPCHGASIQELRALVQQHRDPSHAEAIAQWMETCETARYGGGDASQFDELHAGLLQWIRQDDEWQA